MILKAIQILVLSLLWAIGLSNTSNAVEVDEAQEGIQQSNPGNVIEFNKQGITVNGRALPFPADWQTWVNVFGEGVVYKREIVWPQWGIKVALEGLSLQKLETGQKKVDWFMIFFKKSPIYGIGPYQGSLNFYGYEITTVSNYKQMFQFYRDSFPYIPVGAGYRFRICDPQTIEASFLYNADKRKMWGVGFSVDANRSKESCMKSDSRFN